MLTLLLGAAALIAILYLVFGREKAQLPVPPPSAPPAPELPCLDERCSERPDRLECARWFTIAGAHDCEVWHIVYEPHCTCLERGSPKLDGGTAR